MVLGVAYAHARRSLDRLVCELFPSAGVAAGRVDSADLALDLEVDPDGSWQWKDEDEYQQSRRLGLISDSEHKAVQEARGQALASLEARSGLFASNPDERWLPDPAWPVPALP